MAKDNSENLYNILLDIREDIGVLKSKSHEHDLKLDQLIVQTTKTNGRVTKLEDITCSLNKTTETLTAMFSKQDGIYNQNLLELSKWRGDTDFEIDELKKKAYTKEGADTSKTELEVVKITEGGKVKIVVWGGVFTLLGSVITLLINYLNK